MPYIKTPAIKKRTSKDRTGLLERFFGFLKDNQKAIYIVSFILLLAVGGYVFRNKKETPSPAQTAVQPAEEKRIEKKPETYSRVTFFFTQPIKGSLAMPESWEGRYRMTDNGNTVNFSYIGNPQMMAGLFSLTILSQEEWAAQNPQAGSKIAEQDGYVFIYKKADSNPYQGEELDKYLKMLGGADEIVQSFKGFKL